MNPYWRILSYSVDAPAQELAAGAALLAGLAIEPRPALRWYGAPGLALVIGSGQKPAEVDGAALRAAGVTLHRRASGGTAVLFTPDFLMQDIALPRDHPLYLDDVSESYAWIGQVWQEALAGLGLPTELVSVAVAREDARTADPLARRACFGGRSPYELLAGGRKLVGFSQVRRRQGALIQVGVYGRWPGRELAELLHLSEPDRAALVETLGTRVVGLEELLPAPPDPEEMVGAFAAALERRHGVLLEPAAWRDDELAARAETAPRFAPINLDATYPFRAPRTQHPE